MTQIPIVRQILSDPDTGLLSYLSQQLQTPSFSHFKSQFGFYVDESCTQVTSVDDSLEIQTILLLTLKLSIIFDRLSICQLPANLTTVLNCYAWHQ